MLRWRSDGTLAKNLAATRRIMPYIMRKRNESVVFFEQTIDVTKTLPVLQKLRDESGLHVTLLQALILAFARTLHARPRLNRFCAGGRIFQRHGIWVSFSAKKGMTDGDPVVVLKREINPDLTLLELSKQVLDLVKDGKSDKRSATDKELRLVFRFPSFVVGMFARLMMRADAFGLLPRSVIQNDPMYASVFIANLGSVGLDAAFHHLYEYGNIPVFATVGKTEQELVLDDNGKVSARTVVKIRYSFDERIEDGLYCAKALDLVKQMLEDPTQLQAALPPTT
jgi:2-oxoacid dehydrogenases acyltransferase (catalytic domain)